MSYKRGDLVIAREGNRMNITPGTDMKVASAYMDASPPYVSAYRITHGVKNGGNYNCYLNEIVPATKEDRVRIYKGLIVIEEEKLKKLKEELDFFEKYDCEEDYVADKIARIMTSGGNKEAISEILKERRTRIL